VRTGEVVQVYPRLHAGRVVADVRVAGLGDYFVGERALVWVATGERKTFVVPPEYLTTRHGVTYATLDGGRDVVVQTGARIQGDPANGPAGVEVLSGLRPGDLIVMPETTEAAR